MIQIKQIPSFEIININSNKYEISYEVIDSDIDNVVLNKTYNLYLNDELVKSSNELKYIFTNLLSGK